MKAATCVEAALAGRSIWNLKFSAEFFCRLLWDCGQSPTVYFPTDRNGRLVERCKRSFDLEHFEPKQLSAELLHHLRGTQSQQAFGRSLGFESNVAYTWESGRRFPETSVFLRAAGLSGVAIRPRLRRFLRGLSPRLEEQDVASPRAVQRLCQILIGDWAHQSLAVRMGIDRTTLSRWKKGSTEPRLPELLSLVAITTQRWLEFVAIFVEPSLLPSARQAEGLSLARQRIVNELPWSQAILKALELRAYQVAATHSSALLARELGLKAREVETHLAQLSAAGYVRWVDGHWQPKPGLEQLFAGRSEGRRAALHWAELTGQALRTAEDENGDAFLATELLALKKSDLGRARELHQAYMAQLKALTAEGATAECVVLVSSQLIPVQELKLRS